MSQPTQIPLNDKGNIDTINTLRHALEIIRYLQEECEPELFNVDLRISNKEFSLDELNEFMATLKRHVAKHSTANEAVAEIKQMNVVYLESRNDGINCHYMEGKKMKMKVYNCPMTYVTEQLTDEVYEKVNRSVVVVKKHVKSSNENEVTLSCGNIFRRGKIK